MIDKASGANEPDYTFEEYHKHKEIGGSSLRVNKGKGEMLIDDDEVKH